MDKYTRIKIARLEKKIARLEKIAGLQKNLKKLINTINKELKAKLGKVFKKKFKAPNLKSKVKFQGEKYTLRQLIHYAEGNYNPKLKKELAGTASVPS